MNPRGHLLTVTAKHRPPMFTHPESVEILFARDKLVTCAQ